MFVSIVKSKRYWKSVLLLALAFILIFSIIEHFIEYKRIAWDQFTEDKIENYQWIRYLISRLIGGLFYGMIMGYFFEMKKRSEN